MMPSDSVETIEPRSNGIGPGDRLQAARIEQGLSIEDVANRMHLSVNILESIEVNSFDQITAPIFVKGYLRAYARIVALSEDEIIQQYIEFYSDEDPPINSTSNTSPEISADDARIKWTTYIVVLALCGLLAAWWWNNSQNRGDVVSLDVDQSNMNLVESADDSPLVETPEVAEISAASDSDLISESQQVAAIVVEPGVVDDNELPTETAASEVETLVEAEAPVVETVVTIEPETELAETESTEIERVETEVSNADIPPEVNRTAPSGSDVLNLIIHADTWADIKDANGNRLAYDLLRADREVKLTGEAPFSVFFGNGHGVEVIVNSEEVDISQYIRNDNTARLKLGNS